MSRRSFCSTLVGVLVAPSIAIAQGSKVRRIGVLEPGTPNPDGERKEAEPLRKLGWIEGQNLQVERRYDYGRSEALQSLADELVRAKVEIIVTGGTPATLAAKRATSTIPIVIRAAGDPVLTGLVASLARPGGNVTGYSDAAPEVTAKYLSVLKELLPRLQRIGVLWRAGNPFNRAARSSFEDVCKSLGLVPAFVEIGAADKIDVVIAQLATAQRSEALMVPGADLWERRFEIVDAATKHGLPSVTNESDMVRDGGFLMAYDSSVVEQINVRAEYIDRILRGAKPADLPVRQPTKFVLVINLKTAKALGIAIPQSLLLRADEVIR
jgi:putative ABC transport system substrate-binding protein